MIRACPGCSLSNLTRHQAANLVYSFPIDAPIQGLFIDIYAAGAEANFDGTKHYLIAADDMTSFAFTQLHLATTNKISVRQGKCAES